MSFALPAPLARLTAPAKRLMIVAFLVDFGVACLGLGIQWRAIDMGASPLVLGLLGTVSAAAYTLVCLFAGSISDRLGRRLPAVIACVAAATIWLLMLTTPTEYHLLALMPFSGGALALLWPAMQAWLAEFSEGSRHQLNRTISLFNVSWTAGIMLGPLAAGLLSHQPQYLLFVIPALVTYLSIALLYVTPAALKVGEAPVPLDTKVAPEKIRLFLHLAWVGNFASWFCRAAVGAMFPALGEALQFPRLTVGVLIFVLSMAQLATFGLARLSHRWHYHLRALLFAECLGIAGMLVAAYTRSPGGFVLAFTLGGICAGITYVSSLMYSLEGSTESRGKRSGLHEAVLGSGIVVGPLIGGSLAEVFNLHMPFYAAAWAFAAAILVQVVLATRNRHIWNTVRP